MKSTSVVTLLAASLAATPIEASVGFNVDTTTCNGNAFDDLDISITCEHYQDSSSTCYFGELVTIDGTVEAIDSFPDTSNVTMKACIWGYCPEENIRQVGTICNWLTPTDNQTCGEVGGYTVHGEEYIPQADIPDSFSWLVKIHLDFSEECEVATVASQASTHNGYQMPQMPKYKVSYSMMGAVIGSACGVAYAFKKKLICSDDDDVEDNVGDYTCGDFIEMA